MDIQKLKTALQKATARGRVALIGHDAPDVDSVVSCVLMAALCAAWQIPAEIILPTQADEQTRQVMPKFGVHPDALMKPTRRTISLCCWITIRRCMRAKSARASTITRRRIPRKGISSASSRLARARCWSCG